jgi:F0F1-type ATP synthase assembly protein I
MSGSQRQEREEKRAAAQEWAREKGEIYQTYLRTSAWGLELGLSIVFGAVAGFFIGRWLGSQTVGLVIGFCFGVAAAVKRLVQITRIYLRENAEDPQGPDAAKEGPKGHDPKGADSPDRAQGGG